MLLEPDVVFRRRIAVRHRVREIVGLQACESLSRLDRSAERPRLTLGDVVALVIRKRSTCACQPIQRVQGFLVPLDCRAQKDGPEPGDVIALDDQVVPSSLKSSAVGGVRVVAQMKPLFE